MTTEFSKNGLRPCCGAPFFWRKCWGLLPARRGKKRFLPWGAGGVFSGLLGSRGLSTSLNCRRMVVGEFPNSAIAHFLAMTALPGGGALFKASVGSLTVWLAGPGLSPDSGDLPLVTIVFSILIGG
ncbi:MAG: hypothetical protein CM15mP103_00920 [Gammaproteobacteria bacterium]|nr:MAG: hypothetical protein CM15mP103_00920 [Gammaproteobacteria bacterium]